jgi:O-antigen/teichoic acid export membrane protein
MFLKLINFSWLFSEHVIRIVTGFFVMTLVARHLGPERFGAYAYVFGLVSLLLPVALFGLNPLITRSVAENPVVAGAAVRRGLALRLGPAIATAFALIAFVYLFKRPVGVTVELACLAALVLIASPGETFLAAATGLERLGRLVIPRMVVAICAASMTAWFVLRSAGLGSFVAIRGIEAVAQGCAAWIGFAALGVRRSQSQADTVNLRNGVPLMLAAFATIVYMRIDQVMLGQMSSAAELGKYGVAARIVDMMSFVSYAIQSTTYPALVRNHGKSPAAFDSYLQRMFDVQALAAWPLMIGVGLASWLLLPLVFGEAYRGALPMLGILLLATPLFFLNQSWQAALSVRGWLWTAPAAAGIGALLNVGLNLILIPVLGGRGAAIATVVSYMVAGIGVSVIVPRLRPSAVSMMRALDPVSVMRRTYRQYAVELKA